MANWLVNLLVLLGVLAIVIVAGWFILGQITMPDPIRKIVIIVFVVWRGDRLHHPAVASGRAADAQRVAISGDRRGHPSAARYRHR